MKKRIYRFVSCLSEKTELPLSEICREPIISILGRREITVDGAVSVVKYEREIIILELCNDIIKIYGKKLEMKSYSGTAITIGGEIEQVEFGGQICP